MQKQGRQLRLLWHDREWDGCFRDTPAASAYGSEKYALNTLGIQNKRTHGEEGSAETFSEHFNTEEDIENLYKVLTKSTGNKSLVFYNLNDNNLLRCVDESGCSAEKLRPETSHSSSYERKLSSKTRAIYEWIEWDRFSTNGYGKEFGTGVSCCRHLKTDKEAPDMLIEIPDDVAQYFICVPRIHH